MGPWAANPFRAGSAQTNSSLASRSSSWVPAGRTPRARDDIDLRPPLSKLGSLIYTIPRVDAEALDLLAFNVLGGQT